MLERSSIGVLGVLVSGLALAGLSAQPQPFTRSEAAAADARPAPGPSAPTLRALRDGERVALNAARAADLELLPGIGPKLAERILAHRKSRGPFQRCDDLLQVRGIGPRTLDRLRPLLECGAAVAQPSKNQTTAAATAR